MQKHHILFLFLFLFLFLTMLAPSTPTQQLNNIIDALIGAGDFTAWVSILSSANATALPVSATLLVPRDGGVDRPPPDPLLIPYHVVPQRLLFGELLLLPRHARLPTLLAGKSLSVTDNSRANFSLDNTPLTHPDLFITPSLALHGVRNFLDYSLFGDAFPPPPPLLPIGDAIGTDWNSAPSLSRSPVYDVVFFLSCFILPLLL